MSFSKVLSHPNKNIIVRMLTRGDGVRKVAQYLKERYPKDKSKQISVPTLQAFRKQKLNIEGEALEVIKVAAREKRQVKNSKHESAQIRKLPAYKEKVKEIINYHVDIQNELKELMILVKARIEDLFDKAMRGEITINEEANLQRYFQIVTTTIERWAKYVEKIADKTVETNVNITVIENQMSLMREAVREVIEEMDPEMAIKFLDKLNNKMTTLSYKHKSDSVTFEEIKNDTHMLTTNVVEINDGD